MAMYAKKLKMASRGFYESTRDLIFPPCCPLCAVTILEDQNLCVDCWDELRLLCQPCCELCGAEVEGFPCAICEKCYLSPRSWDYGSSCVAYAGAGRNMVLRLKSMRAENLAKFMANLMWREKRELVEHIDVLVPIPLHPIKQIQRGYNQAALLAFWLGKFANKPISRRSVKRVHYTEAQSKLMHYEARFENLKTSMELGHAEDVMGKNILIIDDVLTSGASFEFATLALRKASPKSIGVLAFARASDTTSF